jgi:hypothetical protein
VTVNPPASIITANIGDGQSINDLASQLPQHEVTVISTSVFHHQVMVKPQAPIV